MLNRRKTSEKIASHHADLILRNRGGHAEQC